MGRLLGAVLVVIGIALWYYGGTSGAVTLVNLGIGSIILGITVASFRIEGYVDRKALPLVCSSGADFLENLMKSLGAGSNPVVIPPYENLPRGGIFLPAGENIPPLGLLDEESLLVEEGLLISPPPGWGTVEYILANVEGLLGSGVGYSSSAISSALSALGLGSGEAFEEGDSIELFVRPVTGSPFDPLVGAFLVGLAMGTGELLRIGEIEERNEYLRLKLERLGGIERWL